MHSSPLHIFNVLASKSGKTQVIHSNLFLLLRFAAASSSASSSQAGPSSKATKAEETEEQDADAMDEDEVDSDFEEQEAKVGILFTKMGNMFTFCVAVWDKDLFSLTSL